MKQSLALMCLLLLSLAACEREPIGLAETGPETACVSDADCWCAAFDGADFIEGERVPSRCCAPEHGHCEPGYCWQCAYF